MRCIPLLRVHLFLSYLLSFTSFSPRSGWTGSLKASAEILSPFPLQEMIFCLKLTHLTHRFKRQNGLLFFCHSCSRYPVLRIFLTFLAFSTGRSYAQLQVNGICNKLLSILTGAPPVALLLQSPFPFFLRHLGHVLMKVQSFARQTI